MTNLILSVIVLGTVFVASSGVCVKVVILIDNAITKIVNILDRWNKRV